MIRIFGLAKAYILNIIALFKNHKRATKKTRSLPHTRAI